MEELDGLLWNHGGSGDDVQDLCPGRIVSVLAPTSRYAAPFVQARADDGDRGPLWVVRGRGRFARQVAAGAVGEASRVGVEVLEKRADQQGAWVGEPPATWDLFSVGTFEDDVAIVNSAASAPRPPRAICSVAAGVHDFETEVDDPGGIYGIAQWFRELVGHDPAANVRLPAMDATPRDRVATPAEFAKLLDVLELEDALPFALAGYGTARKQEIRTLDWLHVDLKLGAIELAADEEGRKPGGSWRVVPLVKPLRPMLRKAWIAQGRPAEGKVCPPRQYSPSGLLSVGSIQERVHREWRKLKLEPIGLHESRHTAATWLDHAGVSRKVASTLMGHKTPEYQPGAASITLRRYTHTLPGGLERARDLLDKFLAARVTPKRRARR
jgi:integrase